MNDVSFRRRHKVFTVSIPHFRMTMCAYKFELVFVFVDCFSMWSHFHRQKKKHYTDNNNSMWMNCRKARWRKIAAFGRPNRTKKNQVTDTQWLGAKEKLIEITSASIWTRKVTLIFGHLFAKITNFVECIYVEWKWKERKNKTS